MQRWAKPGITTDFSVRFHHAMTARIREISYFKIAKVMEISSLEAELGRPHFWDKAIKEIKLESTFDRLVSFFFFSEALIPLLLATFPIWQIHTLFWNWRDGARNLQRKEGGGAPQPQSLPAALNISSRTVSSSQERLELGREVWSLSSAGNFKSTCLHLQASRVVTSSNPSLISITPW